MTSFTRIVLISGLSALASSVAIAADLPARSPPAPYLSPAPVFTWTGVYFGINGGYSFNDATKYNLSNGVGVTPANTGIGTSRPATFKHNDDGFTAGGQIGYNYEFGGGGFGGPGSGIVVGVEADAAYMDATSSAIYTGTGPTINDFRSGLDFLGTVRGRAGYAFNQFLIYGTGGFAYGETFQKTSLYTAGDPTLLRFYGSHSGMQTGYAYGGGIEYALPTGSFLNFFHSSAVTIKAEYLHFDLGSTNFPAAGVTTTSAYNIHTRTDGDLARVGLNYKF